MKIKPINGVLIKQLDKEDKVGGMVIPKGIEREAKNMGIIIEMPQDPKGQLGIYKKGDTIVFQEFAGEQVKMEDEFYLLIAPEDILAVIRE